ncbi:tRNA pseudouridine(38-40) synthase TruA [Marinicella sp. W31]|uniref:tRNA pseudouridine(38-40) synthase TruA n=1 Tax=Marinicella sp. W31 TaxID=3023713 RepID=UPI0037571019
MRYACGLEYDGSGYQGFQTQKNGPSVQVATEKAFTSVAAHDVQVFCAGRTDTGVNALSQVIHFDSDAKRSERQWLLGVNSALPRDISVLWVRAVDTAFHARFSALSRSYVYKILNRAVRPAIGRQQLSWELKPLDEKKMHAAAQYLKGEHDFNALRSSQCQSKQPIRQIQEISVRRFGEIVQFDVTANGFLHHMVRNIMGCLIPIGLGDQSIEWMQQVLESKDRKQAGITASPQGLSFKSVQYPSKFGLDDVTHIQ